MGNTPRSLRRGPRRYTELEIPTWGCGAMETFESGTLDGGGSPYNGWLGPGRVTLWGGTAAYEDFETGTLNGGGADFGWSGTGIVYFPCVATLSAAFADLGSTFTISVTPTGAVAYQWFQNGVALTNGGEYSGVTTSTLTITGVTNPDYTTYYCQVTGLGGTVEQSNTVTLIDRASDWKNRAVLIGGNPSGPTVTALRTFWNGLISDSLSASIKVLNALVPDDLQSAQTPFVIGTGLATWTNHNFVSGDLTVDGIIGNGSSKYFETGFVPSVAYASNAHAGVTIYVSANATNVPEQETGCIMSSTQVLSLYGDYAGTTYFDAYDQSTGRINAVNTSYLGYLSANAGTLGGGITRAVFKANSGTPHTTLVSGSAAATGTLPNQQMLVMAAYGTYPTVAQFSKKRLSFVAYHSEFTAPQSSSFFNRIQALRTALGGGFV